MTPVDGESIADAVVAWADAHAQTIASRPLVQHTPVFVPDAARDGLVLAAQRRGPFEETGDVRAGSWVAGFAALPGVPSAA